MSIFSHHNSINNIGLIPLIWLALLLCMLAITTLFLRQFSIRKKIRGTLSFELPGWFVFPVFSSRSDAEKLWSEQVEPLGEKNLRIRFIEQCNGYEFLLCAQPLAPGRVNVGFYRRLGLSGSYNVFKASFSGKVNFTFGIIGDGDHPTYLKNYKLVTDVKFMKAADVEENSIEGIARDRKG